MRLPLIHSTLIALAATAAGLTAQTLPGTYLEVTDDPQAPDYCGISHLYTLVNLEYTQMGGAACADFDKDGLVDVFLPGNKNASNKLYKNMGNGSFTDVAVTAGVRDTATASATGVFADYDNDGDLDLFVAAHGGFSGTLLGPLMRLFRNRGAAAGYSFENVSTTAAFSLAPTVWPNTSGWQAGMAIGDYNRDGFLDVVATWWWHGQHVNMWRIFKSAPNPVPGDPADPAYTPRIFVDATVETGLNFQFNGEPWQPMFMDYNRDGWPDLHVNVDFDLDYMFRNNQDGTFTDVASRLQLNGAPPDLRNEMGSAMGDIDNDGDFDLHLTNLNYIDRFYRADTTPSSVTYVDVAPATGMDNSSWGWGDSFFDFDNDGDLDHATVSGFKLPTITPYYGTFFINLYPQMMPDGVTVAWQDAALQVPEFSKVLTPEGHAARGLTWLDYDNDGDVDLVVTRHQTTTAVYKNTLASPNKWLQVDLIEAGGSLNTVGARAWVKTSDRVQMREVVAGNSFQCQEPPRLHFGLGLPPFGSSSLGVRGPSGPGTTATSVGSSVSPSVGSAAGGGSLAGQPAPAPPWMVIRWLDGSYQVVKSPTPNTILTVTRGAVNDAGDMNADGHLNAADQSLLLIAVNNPDGYRSMFPDSPGMIVGDIDGNGFVEVADYNLWSQLPPH